MPVTPDPTTSENRAAIGAHHRRGDVSELVECPRDWDGPLTFSVTPQMHDRTHAQVTESLRMQRWVVMSASRLAAGRSLHVGPVTLRPRFSAVATTPRHRRTAITVVDGYGPQFVPDATDPAQYSAAAQQWFEASEKALTVPGGGVDHSRRSLGTSRTAVPGRQRRLRVRNPPLGGLRDP